MTKVRGIQVLMYTRKARHYRLLKYLGEGPASTPKNKNRKEREVIRRVIRVSPCHNCFPVITCLVVNKNLLRSLSARFYFPRKEKSIALSERMLGKKSLEPRKLRTKRELLMSNAIRRKRDLYLRWVRFSTLHLPGDNKIFLFIFLNIV